MNYTDGSYRSDKKTYNLTNSNNNDISVPLDFGLSFLLKDGFIFMKYLKKHLLTKSKK